MFFTSKSQIKTVTAFLLFLAVIFTSCKKVLVEEMNSGAFPSLLSEHNIFVGKLADLQPAPEFHLYDLSSTLFTDLAEKQRLVFVPQGSKLKGVSDDLVEFPLGTVLVKTFYYFKDKRNESLGKKIQETRLLIKLETGWNVATYMWNEAQTDAQLLTVGYSKNVNWIDENGDSHAISYKIPSNDACVTCHNLGGAVMPIGPKVQNWNRMVVRNGDNVNQLTYLIDQGILENLNPTDFFSLPDYKDAALENTPRARAYFEVNCAHCHNPQGFAAHKSVDFLYATLQEEMGLGPHADHLGGLLDKGKMPKLGTTTVDKEGTELMKNFLKGFH